MENKRLIAALLATALLCLLPAAAQDEIAGGDWRLEQTDGVTVIKQILRWDPVEYATRYSIVVERSDPTGAWQGVFSGDTSVSEIELSLEAGEYRYRVTVYNLLDKPGTQSEWFPLSVIKAYQPSLERVSPTMIYLEEINDGVFRVDGGYLLPSTKFTLRAADGKAKDVPASIVSVDDSGKRAEIQVPLKSLDTATYELYAENPGGLNDSASPVTVKYRKPFDLDVSLGYMGSYVLYDRTFDDYFGASFLPFGVLARVTAVPFKRGFGFFGLGLSAGATRASAAYDSYALSANLLFAHLNAVFQKPLIRNRLNLDAHAGAGVAAFDSILFEFDNGVSSPAYTSWNYSADFGLALQIYPARRFYAEVGCDYVHAFTPDMSFGLLLPSVSAGWQF